MKIQSLILLVIHCTLFFRPYAEKAKWADLEVPLGHLRDLFAKYVPPTVLELRQSFVHVVPLNTMNFVTTLCAILEVSWGAAGRRAERVNEVVEMP